MTRCVSVERKFIQLRANRGDARFRVDHRPSGRGSVPSFNHRSPCLLTRRKMDVNSFAILPPAAGTICRARFTNGLVNNQGKLLLPSGRGVQLKLTRRTKPLASWVATCALLLSPCVPIHTALLKSHVDFSSY